MLIDADLHSYDTFNNSSKLMKYSIPVTFETLSSFIFLVLFCNRNAVTVSFCRVFTKINKNTVYYTNKLVEMVETIKTGIKILKTLKSNSRNSIVLL